MRLEKVSVEDIYPDKKNPREDFGNIKALAESFLLNETHPGEPINPPVVVQDGGIYRIVDGERRYRAIKHNKLSHCHVTVCDGMDEANALIAMVATDDKQQLTEIERSRGVQQMMMLGVDLVKVEKVGRMKPGSVAKAKRAMELVEDAAEDMTLDRLLAIEEFSDDPEAVEVLTNCAEKDWAWKASDLRHQKERAERHQILLDKLKEASVEIYESSSDTPEGYTSFKGAFKYDESLSQYEDLQYIAVIPHSESDSCWIYAVPSESDEPTTSPEEEERQRRVSEVKTLMEEADKSHLRYFASKIRLLPTIPHIAEALETEVFEEGDFGQAIDDFEELAPDFFQLAGITKELTPLVAIYAYMLIRDVELSSWYASDLVDGWSAYTNYSEKFENWLDWIGKFEINGYELTEADEELKILCKEYIEKMKGEDDDNEDQ